jgi:hypothetical protein
LNLRILSISQKLIAFNISGIIINTTTNFNLALPEKGDNAVFPKRSRYSEVSFWNPKSITFDYLNNLYNNDDKYPYCQLCKIYFYFKFSFLFSILFIKFKI